MLRNRNYRSMQGLHTVCYENYCSATLIVLAKCISCLLFVKTMPNYLLLITGRNYSYPEVLYLLLTSLSWRHHYQILKRCWKLNFLQNVYLGFIMNIFFKSKKTQWLTTYTRWPKKIPPYGNFNILAMPCWIITKNFRIAKEIIWRKWAKFHVYATCCSEVMAVLLKKHVFIFTCILPNFFFDTGLNSGKIRRSIK